MEENTPLTPEQFFEKIVKLKTERYINIFLADGKEMRVYPNGKIEGVQIMGYSNIIERELSMLAIEYEKLYNCIKKE